MVEPGEIAPVPSLLAIETLTAYLRYVDSRREDRRTWEDFVVDNGICNHALLARCTAALEAGRRSARARIRVAQPASAVSAPHSPETGGARWQLRLQLNS